jgi:hypothetical protein
MHSPPAAGSALLSMDAGRTFFGFSEDRPHPRNEPEHP